MEVHPIFIALQQVEKLSLGVGQDPGRQGRVGQGRAGQVEAGLFQDKVGSERWWHGVRARKDT